MWKGWESARKRPRVVIQKDVAKRVCSVASVRPSTVRLPSVIAYSAANFGMKMGLELGRLPVFRGGGGTRQQNAGLSSRGSASKDLMGPP